MAVQVGAVALQSPMAAAALLGGVPGVPPGRVLILGGGVVGSNAALMAIGLGADVTLVDRSIPRLRLLEERFGARLKTLAASQEAIESQLLTADLVIGAVLVPGAAAPGSCGAPISRKCSRAPCWSTSPSTRAAV